MWKVTRVRLRFYILPLIFLLITVYFMYHLIEGERGLFRLFVLNQELKQAEVLLTETTTEKARMEKRVCLLSAQALDADMLDEAARNALGFVKEDEYIIFD